MIRTEYLRFLQTLHASNASENVRKVANLVLANLEELIPLTTGKGQRIKKMVELAQKSWVSTSSDIEPLPEPKTTEQTGSITHLRKLSVGPFRGFAKLEEFDLDSPLVLIYGPNGTGKSSFCEAIEYALLGNVAEAESKRFRIPQAYLKNAHTDSFNQPILIGVDNQGEDVQVSPDENLFRFCFVEKNRIDSFSRIAAQTPAKQTELISTLFGLDAFTEFVRNFTDTIDKKYIDIEGVKAKDLESRRQALTVYQHQLENMIPEQLQGIESEETTLSNTYREGCTFSQMVTELNGSEDNFGLIKLLEDDLQKPMASKSNLTDAALQTLKQNIEADIEEQNSQQAELSQASQQVSFKQLYEAVIQLRESGAEQCPACKTPLTQVNVNPFSHAETELKNLEHLGQLEESVKKLESHIGKSLERLSEIIKACCTSSSENNPLTAFKDADKKALTVDW